MFKIICNLISFLKLASNLVMQTNTDLLKKTYPFVIGYFIFIILGMTLLAYYGKDQLHLIFNQYTQQTIGIFFGYFTYVGTAGFSFFLLLFFIRKITIRQLFTIISALVLAGIIMRFIKRPMFKHIVRPQEYFEVKGIHLQLIEGIEKKITYTFPSGHSATAFCFFFFLATLTKNRFLQFLYFCIAGLVAISRVYLSQHFALDTYGGATIGVFCFGFMYYFWLIPENDFLNQKAWNVVFNRKKI